MYEAAVSEESSCLGSAWQVLKGRNVGIFSGAPASDP